MCLHCKLSLLALSGLALNHNLPIGSKKTLKHMQIRAMKALFAAVTVPSDCNDLNVNDFKENQENLI